MLPSGFFNMDCMEVMSERYGIEWQFTPKSECGKRIVEILGGSNGEVNASKPV
jgi:hypothetical protein